MSASASGPRPRSRARPGIEVGRGIVVDDAMRTQRPAVLAVGECAEHRGMVYGLVAPIHEQAAVAAELAARRRDAAYDGSLQWAKLKVMGVDLVSIGAAGGRAGGGRRRRRRGVYRKLVRRRGPRRRRDPARRHARHRGPARRDPRRRAGRRPARARWPPRPQATAADLPDAAQICNCNGVCKGEIVAAVRDGGCATPREVMARTRAGTGCGSCKATVVEIVALETGGAADEPAYLCPCRKQTREQLAAVIRERGLTAVSEVADACGTGRECGACKPALAYLVSEVNANRHREERGARFINDRVHANIQNDGTFSVVPRMYGGVTTPDELRRIADAADRYDVRMVKVTGGQRIDLLGVRKEDLPDIWRDLGMPSGHAYAKAVRTVKTCVGADFCRFGLGDSIGLGIATGEAVGGAAHAAQGQGRRLGLPAQLRRGDGQGHRRRRRRGRLADPRRRRRRRATCARPTSWRRSTTPSEAMRIATTFLQYYRENADYKERLYDFVPRIGLEEIREIVLDEPRAPRCASACGSPRPRSRDPWLERDEPYHPRQFSDLDAPTGRLVGPPAEGAR